MALKSEIWVQAYIRAQYALGKPVMVVKRGAAEAGAIFIIINCLDGRFRLLGPAPGPAYNTQGERCFIDEIAFPTDELQIAELLERRRRYDPDIWIIEAEDRDTVAGLKITLGQHELGNF